LLLLDPLLLHHSKFHLLETLPAFFPLPVPKRAHWRLLELSKKKLLGFFTFQCVGLRPRLLQGPGLRQRLLVERQLSSIAPFRIYLCSSQFASPPCLFGSE
jgi:hypothetical protein